MVKGRVQGVFYRASTKTEARKRSLKGTVKNLPNGDVYIDVFGSEDKVAELIEWCKQGPQHSKVDEVIVENIPEGSWDSFEVTF